MSDPFDSPVSTTWNAADDWDSESDSDSLCRRMEEFWINVICSDCNTESRFVMAHAEDKALKEYADRVYYRQELDGSLYVLNGYDTVIRSGQWDFKDSKEKRIRELWVQFLAEEQTVPNLLAVSRGSRSDHMTTVKQLLKAFRWRVPLRKQPKNTKRITLMRTTQRTSRLCSAAVTYRGSSK
jgi:hypothetical protein